MPESTALDRVQVPLLTRITQESLDEEYRQVAERRSARDAARRTDRRAHVTAAVVVAAFGILVTVAALQTSANSGVADASRSSLLHQISQRRAEAAQLQTRLVELREQNVALGEGLDSATAAASRSSTRATQLAAQTGFGPVHGPGIVITVDDAPDGEPVRAVDLARLVNGLWAAGAEAISINGKRLTGRSALGNSGAAINLNGPPPLSPPYVVSAIGNKKTLQADLLDTSTGLSFSNLADALGFKLSMHNVDDMTLPAASQRQLRLRSAVEGAAKDNLKKKHRKEMSE